MPVNWQEKVRASTEKSATVKHACMKNLLANKINLDEHSRLGQDTHCELSILEHRITTLYIKCRKTNKKSTKCLINKSTLIELIFIQHAIVI